MMATEIVLRMIRIPWLKGKQYTGYIFIFIKIFLVSQYSALPMAIIC